MNKEKKELTLYKENIEYIKKVKSEQGLRSMSAAVDYIIMQHRKMTDEQTDSVAEKLLSKIEEKYKNMFVRLRLGVTTADRNSQVILEILNSMILNMSMDKMYDTDILESNIVKESKDTVKNRIERYKQIKDNNRSHAHNQSGRSQIPTFCKLSKEQICF